MALKQFWARVGRWTGKNRTSKIDRKGIIHLDQEEESGEKSDSMMEDVVVQKVEKTGIEKLNDGFIKLIERLEGINENLDRQVNQHEAYMKRVEDIPTYLGKIPIAIESHRQLVDNLNEQIKANQKRQEMLIEIVKTIPLESEKQTEKLEELNQISAETSKRFELFNNNLEKLDQSTTNQTDSILHLSRTFEANEMNLRDIIKKQNQQYLRVFVVSLVVSLVSIAGLVGCIIFVLQRT